MTRIRVNTPEISGQTLRVSWTVDPPTSLYRQQAFTLEFPALVDLRAVPERVLALAAVLCLHPHWVLLRPCRVELAFPLPDAEREVWYRLMDAALVTLAAHAGMGDLERSVVLSGTGAAAPARRLPASERCSTSFSSGKDSLLQAGLLTELTWQPVLVATTSPLPGRPDHLTARRRAVFAQIQTRRRLTFVEVRSDFREVVDYDFSHAAAGFSTSVTELTDTFLFLSAQVIASVALGVTHLFQASEAEVQETTEDARGRIIQHRHFMYSAATQRAVSALLAPHGLELSSLTSPLHATQVLRLLWTRYADLSDLQYSCWMLGEHEQTCSRCRDCFEHTFGALAVWDRPARMGLDLPRILREQRDWTPRTLDPRDPAPLPSQLASQRNSRHVLANVRAATLPAWVWAMVRDHPRTLCSREGLEALAHFRAIKRRLDPAAPEWPPRYRPGYLALVDPWLRDRVGAIYAHHFAPEPEAQYADLLRRTRTLGDWLSAPLERGAAP